MQDEKINMLQNNLNNNQSSENIINSALLNQSPLTNNNYVPSVVPYNSDNKKSLYVKIFAFIFALIILITILFYFLSNNKTVVTSQNNNTSFPDLNLGGNLPGETYKNNEEDLLSLGEGSAEGEDVFESVSQLWPKSVAGYNLISTVSGTSTENFVLFMDKETGNIYKSNYPTLETVRLTNTTLQNISSVAFSKNADFVSVLKGSGPYYKLTSSRLGSEPDSSFSESEIDKDVTSLTSSNLENIFYYLKSEENNITSINSFAPTTGKIFRLGELKFSDVFISGEDKQNLYVSSKASSNVKQLTAILNKKTNLINYISSGNSNNYQNDGSVIREGSGLASVFISGDYKKSSNLSLRSFADKCATLRGVYLICGEDETSSDEFRILDYWYSGKISFTDSLSFLKISDGEKTSIPVSLVSGSPLDIYNLKTSDDFMLFQNKNDESLWLVDLVGL